MLINEWMDKQIVINIYNRILFSHKTEWSTDTYYNVDEPQKHYHVIDTWQKNDTKSHILYDSIYKKHSE